MNATAIHPAQRAILDRLADGDFPPTFRELEEITGLSLSGMRYHFDLLEAQGLVTHQPRLSRTIRITDRGREVLAVAEGAE